MSALAVEHVGSTAVPGLAAKPVIDLVVVVEPDQVQAAIERLSAIGYVPRGSQGVEGREVFDVPEGEPRHHHHLYVSPTDSEELRAQLAFRDRLRARPGAGRGVRGAQARACGDVPRRPARLHGGKQTSRPSVSAAACKVLAPTTSPSQPTCPIWRPYKACWRRRPLRYAATMAAHGVVPPITAYVEA